MNHGNQSMGERAGRILIVDDDPAIRRLFGCLLADAYTIRQAASGEEAIEISKTWSPDLVLLDIMMPGLDGYETSLHLKALPGRPPQVIIVSGRSSNNEQSRAFEFGADDYLTKPVDPTELQSRVRLHFRFRESQAATAALQHEVDSHHAARKRAARERIEQVVAVQDVAVLALAKVAESRDNETGQHIVRMRDYSYRLAQELGHRGPYMDEIDGVFLADLYRSAPLHDIGKVGIPDAILLKSGRLTEAEFERMKRHAVIGANILNDVVTQSTYAGFLAMATVIAQFHHERWDGQGYPAGLVGEEIPLPARIVAVADVYDALTSERPYKEAWSPADAKATISEGAGSQFDPVVVEAFQRCFVDIRRIQFDHSNREPVAVGAMSFLEYDLLETV